MPYLRDDLKDFKSYHAGNMDYKIRLDANENPQSITTNVKQKILNWLINDEQLNRYPDTDSTELRTELANYYNLDKNNFVCGVGSDQIIDFITKAFLNANDFILTSSPTFSMYSIYAKLNHGKILSIQMKDDFSLDLDKIMDAVKTEQNLKVIFICSPNNPTGNTISEQDILYLIKNTNKIIVVDEAYEEFSNTSVIRYINDFDNLIILKTFSKAFGIAGARIGYAISNFNICDMLNIVKPPFNIPAFSQKLATFVLQDSHEYTKRVTEILALKQILFEQLSKLSFIKIYESNANFIFFESQIDIYNTLLKNNIKIRCFESNNNKEILRVTVGTKAENDEFIKILKNQESVV